MAHLHPPQEIYISAVTSINMARMVHLLHSPQEMDMEEIHVTVMGSPLLASVMYSSTILPRIHRGERSAAMVMPILMITVRSISRTLQEGTKAGVVDHLCHSHLGRLHQLYHPCRHIHQPQQIGSWTL
jgi:hypothetical protein